MWLCKIFVLYMYPVYDKDLIWGFVWRLIYWRHTNLIAQSSDGRIIMVFKIFPIRL